MKIKTSSEKMLYSTVRLTTNNGNSTGTGFFFTFLFNDNFIVPIIITNKHVINDNPNETVSFKLHVKNGDEPSNEKIDIEFKTKWFFHHDQDLCFCFVTDLFDEIKNKLNKDIFYSSIDESLIWDNNKLEELSAIEDVIMIGYPNGLCDKNNNLPLFRKGITSAHPAIDFNDKNIGVVDMACFPGSSGSPIYILNENGYADKEGHYILGASRLIFLGILFSGPIFSATGEIIIENIPTQQTYTSSTSIMMNLGYYIKAIEILTFKDIILKLLKKDGVI